jgi:hypothetical protein
MEILFGFVLLVLAGAVVLLFAMLAELTARLPTLGLDYRDPSLSPLEEARVGESVDRWPPSLDELVASDDPALVLVLSTACASCERIGAQLSDELTSGDASRTGVLISCADTQTGDDLVRRYGLERLPYHLDLGGRWISEQFGVQTSPTALIVKDRRLETALVFTQLSAVRAALPTGERIAA